MNISGIVIKTSSERLEDVIASLLQSGLCEVHFHDPNGVIIATIEGADTNEEIRKMREIMNMPHVYSAQLAYTYNEEEFSEAVEKMREGTMPVPESLAMNDAEPGPGS